METTSCCWCFTVIMTIKLALPLCPILLKKGEVGRILCDRFLRIQKLDSDNWIQISDRETIFPDLCLSLNVDFVIGSS